MPEPAARQRGSLLAFDFGTKRIGVAVGELEIMQAHPLATIHSERQDRCFAEIAALIDEWKPVRLIVGLPLSLDGAPHAMTAHCICFANQLRERFGIVVDYADERLSSIGAEAELRECGYDARGAKKRLDAQAARIILESYFQRLSTPSLDACHVSSPPA